jgi:hypothetical protein
MPECAGFERYPSKGAAMIVAEQLNVRSGQKAPHRRIAPWWCMWCGCFHLGLDNRPYPLAPVRK